MPILEYHCMIPSCDHKVERVWLKPVEQSAFLTICEKCGEASSFRVMSTPAQIKMADMEKINRRRQRIKEPMWRDLKTGKLTPANP